MAFWPVPELFLAVFPPKRKLRKEGGSCSCAILSDSCLTDMRAGLRRGGCAWSISSSAHPSHGDGGPSTTELPKYLCCCVFERCMFGKVALKVKVMNCHDDRPVSLLLVSERRDREEDA